MSTERERIATRLELYYAAEEAILKGAQSYTIGNRSLTRANLTEIRLTIGLLEGQLKAMDGNKGMSKRVVLR